MAAVVSISIVQSHLKAALLILCFNSILSGCHASGPVFTQEDPNILPCTKSAAFFPKGSLFYGDDQALWESQFLKYMDEPSVYQCSGAEPSIRFLWDRSLSQPIAVRLSIHPDGTGELMIRMLAHATLPSPSEPGDKTAEPKVWYRRVLDQRKAISKDQVERVRLLADRMTFLTDHSLPSTTDGSDWIFETQEAGHYRIVDFRNHPSPTARKLGLYMVRELAGISIPDNAIY